MSDITKHKTRRKPRSKKATIAAIAAVPLLLLAGDLAAGNYMIGFSLRRKKPTSRTVEPPPATSEEIRAQVRANASRLTAASRAWHDSADVELVEITSDDGLRLAGEIVTHPDGGHRWAIVVHGYAGDRTWMYDFSHIWAERGYNVLLPDLRAHGESEGEYIGMGWEDRFDLLKWIALICERDPDAQIVLHGVSMGSATVMMTAGEEMPPQVKAVVEDCGYTSVWDIFSDEMRNLFHMPAFPVLHTADALYSLRTGHSFRTASALEQVKQTAVPMLFLHGGNDNFVRTSMVYELYDACPTQKALYVAPDAGHAESLYIDPEVYKAQVFGFMQDILPDES